MSSQILKQKCNTVNYTQLKKQKNNDMWFYSYNQVNIEIPGSAYAGLTGSVLLQPGEDIKMILPLSSSILDMALSAKLIRLLPAMFVAWSRYFISTISLEDASEMNQN